MKGSNAEELAACDDIDGFLVGGASLKVLHQKIDEQGRSLPRTAYCIRGCPSFSHNTPMSS